MKRSLARQFLSQPPISPAAATRPLAGHRSRLAAVVGTPVVVGCCWMTTTTESADPRRPSFLGRRPTRLDDGKPAQPSKNNTGEEDGRTFALRGLEAFWKTYANDSVPKGKSESRGALDETGTTAGSWDDCYQGIAKDVWSFVTGKGQEDSIKDLVARVRAKQGGGEVEDRTSFPAILNLFDQYVGNLGTSIESGSEIGQELTKVADKYVGSLDLSKFSPTSLLYYMEFEDERKNPSWQRRQHRYCRGINLNHLEELYQSLQLAYLCYADTKEEIESELQKRGYELILVDLKSAPGRPAHFVAVKRTNPQSTIPLPWSSSLPVVIGVRGTKTVADALTDLLCDSADYRGGKAHAFILSGGRYLTSRVAPILEELAQLSGKKLQVSLIGHSLGAGAASIAGMELRDTTNYDVQVVGFGCPALVSQELAESSSSFITTIVNGADVVPRMSGASVTNLLLDVMEFDWLPYVREDIQHALDEFFPNATSQSVMEAIQPHLETFVRSTVQPPQTERLTPELYPPGRCIHFYSDGSGKSAAVVPNDFFKEIHLNRRMIDGTQVTHWCASMVLEGDPLTNSAQCGTVCWFS